jgi:hypothetical protein
VVRRFKICKPIMLGFFGREQYERIIEPDLGHLEFDGSDIYWIHEGERHMSETVNNAIPIWLSSGCIEEQ